MRTLPRPSQEDVPPVAVVQIILSQWAKPSRGGSGAVERNKMPEVLPLPPLPKRYSEANFVIHSVSKMHDSVPIYRRVPGKEMTAQDATEPFECDCVRIFLHDGVLHVDFQWNPSAGMPERYPKKDVFRLKPGEWGQLSYNERHSPYHEVHCEFSTYWYEKWVFNIGLFSAVSSTIFVKGEPTQKCLKMEYLR